MALTATIMKVTRVDRTLDVDVKYADPDRGFEVTHVLNFQDPTNLTVLAARAEIIRVGQQYKDALDAVFTRFQTFVGTVINL